MTAATQILHANSVSFSGRGVLILGASGAGKSTLTLDLLSRGGVLISDDQTHLRCHQDRLIASSPAALCGQIEIRGIGILAADYAGPTGIFLAVDLNQPEPERLPPNRKLTLLGKEIELIYGQALPTLAAAIPLYLKGGRVA